MATKIYNRSFIREHADGTSLNDPYIEKGHSYIFPGDELVFHTKIKIPTDVENAIPSLIRFYHVKMSVIAKKPNIFTEEFSREFQSTRFFTLDEIVVPLNSTNSPNVPWGLDGYAPNVNFKQDRSFRLPSGDFRREIKAYTEHPTYNTWQCNFLFPVLFRWEYWKTLILADNDFYNPLEINNGKSQDWKKYQNLAALPFGWKIYYRFELSYSISRGPIKSLLSEINLSNEATAINTFSSNSDYTDLSIKTCKVGGTPSNSPSIILGDQNTSVFAYLTKVTAWANDEEKNNLSAVVWIEPFEGGGTSARTRCSSIYTSTNDCVFTNFEYVLGYNDGDIVGYNDGDMIGMDYSGAGVSISFDNLDDKKIIIQSEIDYNKLNSIYPGVTNFTIYCRLNNGAIITGNPITTIGSLNITGNQYVSSTGSESYTVAGIPSGYTLYSYEMPTNWSINVAGTISGGSQSISFNKGIGSGTIILNYLNAGIVKTVSIDVFTDSKKRGEEVRQNAVYVPIINPVLPSVFCYDESCDFCLDVFAHPAEPTNFLHNDKKGFYYYGNAAISNIVMTLQKKNYLWQDVATIADNTYGDFFAYGKCPDLSGVNFVDDFGKKYTGILIDWVKVYNAFGAGTYRMKVVKSDIFAVNYTSYTRESYCLKLWNCNNTEGTLLFQILNKGLRGSLDDPQNQIDYYTGWKDQIRLNGMATWEDSSYNREYNQYGDSEFNIFKPIIDEQTAKGKLQIVSEHGSVDRFLSTNVLQADKILITDFNSKNRFTFVQVPIKDGEMTTSEYFYSKSKVSIEIKFSYGQNNLRKRNSF